MPFDLGQAFGGAAEGAASGGPVGGAVGLAAGLVPQIIGLFTGGAQRRRAAQAQAQADGYFNNANDLANQGLSYAKQNLATAQNAYNGRQAGASYLEGNINANQSNTLAALGRNSTSAAQQLSLAGDVQGNTNNAFNGLAQNEAQNKMYQGQNLSYANMGMQGSLSNIQNLNFQRGGMMQGAANQLGQASQNNTQNAVNGLGNLALLARKGFTQGGSSDTGETTLPYDNRPRTDAGGNISQSLVPQVPQGTSGANGNGYNPNNGYNLFQPQFNPYKFPG